MRLLLHVKSRVQFHVLLLESKRELCLGNLDALRDWGHARDYVEAMWLMLQQDTPGDYVMSWVKHHSVREFCSLPSDMWVLVSDWVGCGVEEKGVNRKRERVLKVDPLYFRPSEVRNSFK